MKVTAVGATVNRLSLAADYLARREVVTGHPISLTAETTTHCNLRCPMCVRGSDTLSPTEMSLETFHRLLEGGAGAFEHLILYGLGEPLMDGTFFEKTRRAVRRGFAVQVSTNATRLDEARGRALLDSGVRHLIFSIDAASPEVYRTLRPGGDLAATVENIRAFLRENRRRRSPVFTVAQMVRLPENRDEAESFIRFWRQEGVSAVRIKHDEVRLHEPDARPHRKAPCPVLWRGPFFVRADGSVLPCCHMYNEPPLGRIDEDDLIRLWNHPRMQSLRRAHAEGEGNAVPACRHCFYPVPGRVLTAAAFLPNIGTARRIQPLAERWLRRERLSP